MAGDSDSVSRAAPRPSSSHAPVAFTVSSDMEGGRRPVEATLEGTIGTTSNSRTGSIVDVASSVPRTFSGTARDTPDPSSLAPSSSIPSLSDRTRGPADDKGWATPPSNSGRHSPLGSGPSEEAAALLLNFSAVVEQPPVAKHPAVAATSAPPVYPRTPPGDSPTSVRGTTAPGSVAGPPSPAGPPTPSAAGSEAAPPPKPSKNKRKRNAVAGPSRQSSADPERPQHWMGEDNSIIRCICGFTEDDGFTIQCETCNAWEHGLCFGYRDEASVPDTYYCELCDPRPVDAVRARLQQIEVRTTLRLGRPPEEMEQQKKQRPKAKRQRTESVQIERETTVEENKEAGGMAPPPKPKRRGPSGKPRSKTSETNGGPPSIKDTSQEDDYFRILPWELEYTPIKDNIIRGVISRQAMIQLYREWVDIDESERRHPIQNDSGLPSPTETGVLRLSPDGLFSPPDFSILGPPVPPAFLTGPDLGALAVSTTTRSIDDSACFLPLKYSEQTGGGNYNRPALYGMFVLEPAATGSFLGEYLSEILDTATYRKDPINQYACLGMPKPYVHTVGPPVNLILDARSYGNEMRFVRSGCHPNAVIRPFFYRIGEDQPPKLRFGLFASRVLSKGEEIVLGWEWDDQHVVHTLRALIDSALAKNATIAPDTIEYLAGKFEAILTNAFGTFSSCACTVMPDCAFAQMRQLVSGQPFSVGHGRSKKRIDLGELIGAIRGWRRRELEVAQAAKAKRFRSSGEWEIWRAGPGEADKDFGQPRSMSSRAVSEDRMDEDRQGESTDDHVEVEKVVMTDKGVQAEIVTPAAPTSQETEPQLSDPAQPSESRPSELNRPPAVAINNEEQEPHVHDDAMEVDEPQEAPVTHDAPNEEAAEDAQQTPPPGSEVGAETINPVEIDVEDHLAVASAPSDETALAGATPETPKTTSKPTVVPSSSVLSSIPDAEHEGEDELDSGQDSDATTITVVRSNFSGSDRDSDAEMASPPDSDVGEEVVRPSSLRRSRRVVSPAIESSSRSREPKAKKASKAARPSSAKSTPTRSRPNATRKRSRKTIIESSDDDTSSESEEEKVSVRSPRRRVVPAKQAKSSTLSKVSLKEAEESDLSDVDSPPPIKASKQGRTEDRTDRISKLSLSDRSGRVANADKGDRADSEAKTRVRNQSSSSPKSVRVGSPRAKSQAAVKVEKGELSQDINERAERGPKERREVLKETDRKAKELSKEPKDVTTERPSSKDSKRDKDPKDIKSAKVPHESKKDKEAKAIPDPDVAHEKDKAPKALVPRKEKDVDLLTSSVVDVQEEPLAPVSTTELVTDTAVEKESTKDKEEAREIEKDMENDQEAEPKERSPALKDMAPAKEADPDSRKDLAPPKKVSMKEYLASHKIRKVSQPNSSTTEPVAADTGFEKVAEKPEEKPDITPKTEPDAPPRLSAPVSNDNALSAPPAPPAPALRLDLLEHLPSSRPSTASAVTPSPLGSSFSRAAGNLVTRPITKTTPSSSYVPRTERDLGTTQPAYVPRPNSSYTPRTPADESPAVTLPAPSHPSPVQNSYPGRYEDHQPLAPGPSPIMARQPLPVQTPPKSTQALPETRDLPPALSARDGPPHHPHGHHRVPPTGPRIPPTGPRSSWGSQPGAGPNGSSGPSGPVSPVAPMRSSFGPRGSGFGGPGVPIRGGFTGNGFRPRGGFGRGRGRGM